jgi:hypothetical protein
MMVEEPPVGAVPPAPKSAFSLCEVFAQVFAAEVRADAVQEFVQQLPTFLSWAERSFRPAKAGKQPLAALAAFQEGPIRKPLLASTPKKLEERAVGLFDSILEYARGSDAALAPLERALRENPALVDEFFAQVLKQLNKTGANGERYWALMLTFCSIFPPSAELFRIAAARLARFITKDKALRNVAVLCLVRLHARVRIGAPLSPELTATDLQLFPKEATSCRRILDVSITESMWTQRGRLPALPIPHLIYSLIRKLRDGGAKECAELFATREAGESALAILHQLDPKGPRAIAGAELPDLMFLLRRVLRGLPDPLVPVEARTSFLVDPRAIATKIPPCHWRTLQQLCGFLKELTSGGAGLNAATVVREFAVVIVNPPREALAGAEAQRLVQASAQFLHFMLEAGEIGEFPLPPLAGEDW